MPNERGSIHFVHFMWEGNKSETYSALEWQKRGHHLNGSFRKNGSLLSPGFTIKALKCLAWCSVIWRTLHLKQTLALSSSSENETEQTKQCLPALFKFTLSNYNGVFSWGCPKTFFCLRERPIWHSLPQYTYRMVYYDGQKTGTIKAKHVWKVFFKMLKAASQHMRPEPDVTMSQSARTFNFLLRLHTKFSMMEWKICHLLPRRCQARQH